MGLDAAHLEQTLYSGVRQRTMRSEKNSRVRQRTVGSNMKQWGQTRKSCAIRGTLGANIVRWGQTRNNEVTKQQTENSGVRHGTVGSDTKQWGHTRTRRRGGEKKGKECR